MLLAAEVSTSLLTAADWSRRESASMKNIYIGNLSSSTTEASLRTLFEPFGKVSKVSVINGRGFGFVEMATDSEGQKAITDLQGKTLDGNALTVNEARPKRERN
jgi:cold-inducible RNA-binding protein